MQISKLDTSNLLFDPKSHDFVTELEKIPEFKPKGFKFPVDQRKLYIFIILTYDKLSPLWQMFPNFWHKKKIAAETAGFEIQVTGQFEDNVQAMLFGDNEDINTMIVRYALMFHEPEFVALVSNYEMFIQETAQALLPSSSDEKKKIGANIKFLNSEVAALTKAIFGGNESLSIRKELYKTATSEMLKLRPELVAARLKPDEDNETATGGPTRTFYKNAYTS